MTILFYPEPIGPYHKLYWLCNCFGIKCHNIPSEPYDIIFFWSYSFCQHDDFVKNNKNILNRGCNDVTKTKVDKIFETNIMVNPETHVGDCVKKSELQGAHDGVIIQCPCKREEGYVYQKFIDTEINNKFIDYRLFFAKEIKFIRKRIKDTMFKNDNWEDYFFETEQILKKNEIDFITEKCKLFGLDFGEIDMLIDKEGEKYIIDVNNIAGMLPGFLTDASCEVLRDRNKQAFHEFINSII